MSLQITFDNCSVLQARSSKWKQFVVTTDEFRGKVLKGPYRLDGASSGKRIDKLALLTQRALLLRTWKTPCVVLPVEDVSSEDKLTRYVNESADECLRGTFVAFPNIFPLTVPVEMCDHRESFSQITYQIMKPILQMRNIIQKGVGLSRMSTYVTCEYVEDKSWVYSEDVMYGLLLSLTHLYVCGVGDTGIHNILVNHGNRTVHIADIEESRSDISREDEIFYFTIIPIKHVAVEWIAAARKVYARLLALDNFSISLDSLDQEAIDSLDRATRIFTALISDEKEWVGKKKSDVVAKAGTSRRVKEKKIVPVFIDDDGTLGKMNWAGLFSGETRSYSGCSVAELREHIKVSILASNTDDALKGAVEMYRLGDVGGKAARTNLTNTLIKVCMENFGPSNIGLVAAVIDYGMNSETEFTKIANVVLEMCKADKSDCHYYENMWNLYINDSPTEEIEVDGEESAFLETCKDRFSKFWKAGDPDSLKKSANLYLFNLESRNVRCLNWLGEYKRLSKGKLTEARSRRTDPIEIPWDMLNLVSEKHSHRNCILSLKSLKKKDSDVKWFPLMISSLLCIAEDLKYIPGKVEKHYTQCDTVIIEMLRGQYDPLKM